MSFDGKKVTRKTGEEARKAFGEMVRKHHPPQSPEERLNSLMRIWEDSLRLRQMQMLRMRDALKDGDLERLKFLIDTECEALGPGPGLLAHPIVLPPMPRTRRRAKKGKGNA